MACHLGPFVGEVLVSAADEVASIFSSATKIRRSVKHSLHHSIAWFDET
jgi:hypothetical protein